MKAQSSKYVNDQRRSYSLYVLQDRAIPHASDGLKSAGRRCLWVAKDGKKRKTATLAGEVMRIHPHSPPEGTINSLTGKYVNNIPLFKGAGAFGTLLNPRDAFAAGRYTSVTISEFTKDVIFRDIEIIPMADSYDGLEQEPKHFLPLIPITLLNPQSGIAIGFASSILPRSLDTIIGAQLEYMNGGNITDVYPAFIPTNNYSSDWKENKDGSIKWIFQGEFEKINTTTIHITNVPYGITHEKFTDRLTKAEENDDRVISFVDNSRDHYSIKVKFKRGVLNALDDATIVKILGLETQVGENMNVINLSGEGVWSTSFVETISEFTDWRLGWYKTRYERLARLLEIDIQRYKDILTAIHRNVGGIAKKVQSRQELKEFLADVSIVHVNYIADLPVYRFTEDEKKKVQEKLKEAEALLRAYKKLIKSEPLRKKVYKEELEEVLQRYKKGKYNQ